MTLILESQHLTTEGQAANCCGYSGRSSSQLLWIQRKVKQPIAVDTTEAAVPPKPVIYHPRVYITYNIWSRNY